MRLLEGGGERAELELVAGEISQLLADGVEPAEIAVACCGGGVSRELLGEVLAGAGVPAAIQRAVPFGNSAIGRALIGLLRCVGRGADGAPAARHERRSAGLAAGARAVTGARAGRRPRARAAPPGDDRRAACQGPLGAAQLAAAGARRAAGGPGPLPRRRLSTVAGANWPGCSSAPLQGTATVLAGEQADEALAHAAAARALGELRELAVRAPELAPSDAPALAAELAAVEFLGGRPPAAMRWPCSTPWRCARGACGRCSCADCRKVPSPPSAGAGACCRRRTVSSWERLSGIRLGRPEDPLAAERYLLYAAVSRPEELLVLSWHLADDEGHSTSRSLFVEDVCDLFEEQLLEQPLRGGARGTLPAGTGAWEGTRDWGSDRSLHDERVLGELAGRPWSASQLEK